MAGGEDSPSHSPPNRLHVASLPIRLLVRGLFALTSRDRASSRITGMLEAYEQLARELDADTGSRIVEVPPMRGVDEDMRRWSFFMLLEHNAIVNRSITAIVTQLARGEERHGAAAINPKTDVMPSPNPGPEQFAIFRDSVLRHHEAVAELGPLRGTACRPHPVFGPFDAHRWHCMFAFHLKIHLPQARLVAERARS